MAALSAWWAAAAPEGRSAMLEPCVPAILPMNVLLIGATLWGLGCVTSCAGAVVGSSRLRRNSPFR